MQKKPTLCRTLEWTKRNGFADDFMQGVSQI